MELTSPHYHILRWLWRFAMLLAAGLPLLICWAVSGGIKLDAPQSAVIDTTRGPAISPNLDGSSILMGGIVIVFLLALGSWFLLLAAVRTVGKLKFQRFRFLVKNIPYRLRYDWRIGQWCEQLQEWGFSTVGFMSEETIDGNNVRSLALGSAPERAFASATLLKGQLRYFFYTPFLPTGVLLTTNAPFPQAQTSDCHVYVQHDKDLSAVWKFHRQRLRDLTSAGLMPETDYGPESRLKAAQAFYTHPAIKLSVRRSFFKEGGAIAAVFFLPAILIGIYLIIQSGILLPPAQRLGWQTYRAPDSSFEVALPNPPAEETHDGQHRFWTQANGFIYEVTCTDLSPATRDQAAANLLETTQNALIPSGGTLILARDITQAGHAGRVFRFRTGDDLLAAAIVEGRLYLADQRLYRVSVTYGAPNGLAPSIDVFLDSFRFLNPAK